MNELELYINEIKVLTSNIYYKLITNYSKEIIDNYLDNLIMDELKLDNKKEHKLKIWNKYGYYLCIKEHSIYEKYELENLFKNNKQEKKLLETKTELIHGINLLTKPYLTILKDPSNETTLDIEKIFSSIKSIETKQYILKRLTNFYNYTKRNSLNDIYLKNILKNYSLPLEEAISINNLSLNELKEEMYIKDQIDMYIRYSNSKEKLIENNLPFVKYVIENGIGFEYDNEDLIQEGTIGLIKAVDTFDIRYGFKFSTYAFTVIKNHVKLNGNKYDQGLVLTINKYLIKQKILTKQNELSSILKRTPTTKELADFLEISSDILNKILRIIEMCNYKYLDQEIDFEKESMEVLTLMDVTPDKRSDFEDEIITKQTLIKVLEIIENSLTEKQKEILYKRNGYNTPNGKKYTLNEIAKEKNVTVEAIRQIEAKSLKKLQSYKMRRLNPFV